MYDSLEIKFKSYIGEISLSLAADLHFEFSDSSLESEQLLLKGSFLSFERGDLLLNSTIFCLLEIKVPLHFNAVGTCICG